MCACHTLTKDGFVIQIGKHIGDYKFNEIEAALYS